VTALVAVLSAVAAGVGGAAPLGAVVEFTAGLNAGSSARSIAAAPDGNLWFSDMGTTKAVGRITTGGVITEFSSGLNAGSGPADTVGGADGNVWFADRGTTGAIGRITPAGVITEFSAGLNATSSPRGFALGPDGDLWFGDDGTIKAIGRITTSGVITEFTTGLNAGSSPTGVTAGPDGNVWFADKGTPKAIGRITPAGLITEFSLPASSAPADIQSGPDGNLWFTDQGTPRAIGRITPAGVITEFTGGLNAGSLPNGLTPGPDGNLWFADRGTVKAIGRITPGGTITEFALAATSSPRGVATGADGSIWFSDPGTPRAIGQFGTGAPAASVAAPTVGGTAGYGSAQTCQGATWSDWAGQQPSLTAYGFDGYRWSLDGSPIANATSQTYTPASADVGGHLSCTVTATYTLLGTTVSASSAAVTVLDLTPPILTVPGTIVVDATGPEGTVVPYVATATDAVDAHPAVSCTPPSGSTFPIGSTTVHCTATDAAGNSATGSFDVVVKGAADQLADLEAAVTDAGAGNALEATVEATENLLALGEVNAACNVLAAFDHQVAAQLRARKITADQAAAFVTDADRIQAVLGC